MKLLHVEVPPMSEWPLHHDYMDFEPMYRKCGTRSTEAVPFRECPHGKYHFDEKVAPPKVRNAWIFLPYESCDRPACKKRYQENLL